LKAFWQFLKVSASVGVVYLNCCSKASSFKDNPKSFPTCIGLRAEKYAQSVREDVEEKKHDLEAVPAFHQSNTNEGGKVYLYLLSLVSFLLFGFFFEAKRTDLQKAIDEGKASFRL
jgi:hypothetical protein